MARYGVIVFIFFVLLCNIVLLVLHLSLTSSVSPKTFLRQQISRLSSPTSRSSRDGRDWLERLYVALSDEVLLTRNVKSKAHLWTGIESSSHFQQESGEILVFLGWVAYWVRNFLFLSFSRTIGHGAVCTSWPTQRRICHLCRFDNRFDFLVLLE